MRYKKFQISGAADLDEMDMLWLTDIKIVDGSILQKDRVAEEELESTGRFKGHYEYMKVDKYLYQRVDAGSNEDKDYGQATIYYYVLPETHPGFNFDILYKIGKNDIDLNLINSDNFDNYESIRIIVQQYLPEFDSRNTYE